MLSKSTSLADHMYIAPRLAEDQYIDDYNQQLEEHNCMKQYRNAQYNGSLAAIQGPPVSTGRSVLSCIVPDRSSCKLPRLVSVPQTLYMGNRKYPDIRASICIPIEFWMIKLNEYGNMVLKGLKLTDAIEGNMDGLCRASQSVGLGQSTKVTIRLQVRT